MSNTPSQRETWHPAKKVVTKPLLVSSGLSASMPGTYVEPSSQKTALFGQQRTAISTSHSPSPEASESPQGASNEPTGTKLTWSGSSVKSISAGRKTLKYAPPLLETRRQSNGQNVPPLSSGTKSHTTLRKVSKRKSTRRSVRKSLWVSNASVNIGADSNVGAGIKPFPGKSANSRFDEISARILEEAYRAESVFARCSELLKTWFYFPLLAALGTHSKERLDPIFCGVEELEKYSRKVLIELGTIAQSGRSFLLGETYGECEDYLKAHEKFIGGHRAGLNALATLMHTDKAFAKFLEECSRACGGANVFDLFWVILQRFCTVCKLITAHNTHINTVNSVHATINSCNAFFSAHAPFPCETTCYRVAKAGPTKPAAATGCARILSLQCEAQSLCEAHASIATFRAIRQTKKETAIPISAARRFISSVPVILVENPFYGCTTESNAEILAFSDGIALCKLTPKGPLQRTLLQWYPSGELRAFAPAPGTIEGNDKSVTRNITPMLGTEGSDATIAVVTITGAERDERKFSFMLKLGDTNNAPESVKFLRAMNKEGYVSCERAVINATNGIQEIKKLENNISGDPNIIFGRDLDSLLAHDQRSRPDLTVPIFPQRMCNYILTHCLDEQGIFRIAAGKRIMDAMYKRINNGELDQIDFGEESVHFVPSLLKMFLRDLPSPLIPQELYAAFTAVGALEGIETSIKAEAVAAALRNKRAVLKDLISRIPKFNRDLLAYVMSFLSQVAANSHSNSMDTGNLAIVTAPNILYLKDSTESFPNVSNANNIISYMIANCSYLFDTPKRSWLSFKRKLVGHQSSVRTMCVARRDGDQKCVVSVDESGKCYVWDASNAKYNSTFNLPGGNITTSISILNTIWIASENTIYILGSADFKVLKTIEAKVFAFSVTEDNTEVWCGSQGKVLIVSIAEQSVVAELPTPDGADIFTLTHIPGTETMWSSGSSKSSEESIYVWDTSERYVMGQFSTHKKRTNSIAVSGSNIWTADDEGSICIWNGDTGKLIHTITRHLGSVYSLCALDDQVWSCSWDKTICIWDSETFEFAGEIRGYHVDSVNYFLSVKNDNSVDVWSCSNDNSICVWKTDSRSDEK